MAAADRRGGLSGQRTHREHRRRRLHTVMERLLETSPGSARPCGPGGGRGLRLYVDAHLGELIKDEDLTRYIL